MLKKYKRIIFKVSMVLFIIALILMYIFIKPVRDVVNLLLISFIISYTLKPIRVYLSEKFKLSTKVSSLLIILIGILFFVGILYSLIPAVIRESSNFGNLLDNIEEFILGMAYRFNLTKLPIFETLYIQVGEKINMFLSSLSVNLLDDLLGVMENLVGIAIVPIVTYYLLCDGGVIYNKLLLIFPTEKRVVIKNINKDIDKVLSRYIISQLILCGIIGVLTFILLVVLRIKFPLVLSLINTVANIIPYFGPIIGGIPIVFIALTGSVTKGLLALIGAFLIQQIEGDFLAPRITGDSTNMHPIIIIILLLIGERLGGMIGMVLSVPIAVIIKVIYDDINYYLF